MTTPAINKSRRRRGITRKDFVPIHLELLCMETIGPFELEFHGSSRRWIAGERSWLLFKHNLGISGQ
jgi:hypothetical protein